MKPLDCRKLDDVNKTRSRFFGFALLTCLLMVVSLQASDELVKDQAPKLIAPAISTGTGLLLEPPLDLSSFTREKFVELSSSVGPEKIRKPWTNPVVTLPPHPRAGVTGLTEDEVKAYMVEVKRWFDRGKSVPVSDAPLGVQPTGTSASG